MHLTGIPFAAAGRGESSLSLRGLALPQAEERFCQLIHGRGIGWNDTIRVQLGGKVPKRPEGDTLSEGTV